ncbi:hypothetical protein AB0J01_28385 [Streptomyces sp. NPDC050204]|uniref:hypothetical protein n=1 Tax=Streptomyces sp. NPDC050204 TaxID=3155514 RepID=UPI003420C7C0
MARTKPNGPIDVQELVKKLDAARDMIAYDKNADYYDRHHPERSYLDNVFDGLIEWARTHQSEAELAGLVKPATHPDLTPGDLILVDNSPATVREIHVHGPRAHQDSGLPQHRPALEIVTGKGSQWYTLAPQTA